MLRAIAACTSTGNLFAAMQQAVFFLFMTNELKLMPGVIGLIFSIGSLGALAGALLSARIAVRLGTGTTIIAASLLLGLAGVSIPLAVDSSLRSLAILVWAQAGTSFAAVTYNVNQVSLRQSITPDALQGRMNATMRFLVWGVLPIGSLIGGFLGEAGRLGLHGTLWLGGAGGLLAFVWVLVSPLRSVLRPSDVVVSDQSLGDHAATGTEP